MKKVFCGVLIAVFVSVLSFTSAGNMRLEKAEKYRVCDAGPGPWGMDVVTTHM